MNRALSLHLPRWSIDLIRRRERSRPDSEAAWLLVRTVASRQLVASCCERAVGVGIRLDMTLAHARALWGTRPLHIHPHQPERDERALKALAAWATRYVPRVAVDPPDGLLMDISGCERLYRGESRLLNTVANRLEWLGFKVNVASAATFGCAWAVARYGNRERRLVSGGEEVAAISPLPIEGLRIDDECIEALHEVGVERVSQVLELPRLELDARFGSDLLLRIDQALGEAMETIDPVRPSPPPSVQRTFDGPVTQLEAIVITVRKLLDELEQRLERRERGVCRLDLDVQRADASPIRQTLVLSRPSRSGAHLWGLLRPRVEALHLGFGVEGIVLTATVEGRLPHEQSSCWRAGADGRMLDRSWGEMVDTLVGRLGPESTMRVEPVESHVPERAFRCRPVLAEGAGTRSGARSGVVTVDRPTLVFEHPEPVEVMAMTPDGPVCRLSWRGAEHVVVDTIGPERIATEWWRERARSRDYFKIQDDAGRWLWVFRELETGHWFVQGEWA